MTPAGRPQPCGEAELRPGRTWLPPQGHAEGGEADRDPRAASFALDAWPFRNHRTLAEVLGLEAP